MKKILMLALAASLALPAPAIAQESAPRPDVPLILKQLWEDLKEEGGKALSRSSRGADSLKNYLLPNVGEGKLAESLFEAHCKAPASTEGSPLCKMLGEPFEESPLGTLFEGLVRRQGDANPPARQARELLQEWVNLLAVENRTLRQVSGLTLTAATLKKMGDCGSTTMRCDALLLADQAFRTLLRKTANYFKKYGSDNEVAATRVTLALLPPPL
jgi:hypothetical protein